MVNDVVIHPNQGELISCDQMGSVKIWDLGENTCTHELVPAEDVPIRSVSIASDGGTLVAGNDVGTVFVWRIQSGSETTSLVPVTSFLAHPKYITRCLLSPDTRHLATCSADTTVKLWSTKDYEYSLDRTLEGHQRWVWDAAFSADSAYLVTASSDHSARLWDLATGETVRQYEGHFRGIVGFENACRSADDADCGRFERPAVKKATRFVGRSGGGSRANSGISPEYNWPPFRFVSANWRLDGIRLQAY